MSMDREEYQRRLNAAFRRLLAGDDGRLVLTHLVGRGGIFQTTFTGGSDGIFREGRRALALEIDRLCKQADARAWADAVLAAGDEVLSYDGNRKR